jgi:hypothetical protein
MKITPVHNHGKLRWRVNVQRGSYRRRMFFASREEALAFADAAGTPVRVSRRLTPSPVPPSRSTAARRPVPRKPAKRKPKEFDSWIFG